MFKIIFELITDSLGLPIEWYYELGSYFVSVTASHYDWAMKKLKAHKKNCAAM